MGSELNSSRRGSERGEDGRGRTAIEVGGPDERKSEHYREFDDVRDLERIRIPERRVPECIRLPVRDGVQPDPKPPVRIYLGTEASQFRPERVLVWSIEQVRDPSRVYEIYMMKELAGFDRSRWTTGFTNYRFAIPYFAGSGRAIYNDEDQIYLTDPAELFDLEMGDKGFLAISETESSVMLIDCDRMSRLWSIDAVRTGRKKVLLSRAVEAGLFGDLDPHWNARDGEYVAGRSHLLHYTTLHTQPWCPFPERFVYRDNPLGHLWHDLERDADKAQFSLFDRERPSSRFAGTVGQAAAAAGEDSPELKEPVERASAMSLLRWDPTGTAERRSADAVMCSGGLDALPEDDVPWVLDEVFSAAQRFVFAAVDCVVGPAPGPTETETETSAERWSDHFHAAAHRHPEIHWELLVRRRDGLNTVVDTWSVGGPRFDSELPRVWVVVDRGPEDTEAADALCEALGWPAERIALGATSLAPPWPDLLVASGSGTASVVEAVRAGSLGRTRVVTLGESSGTTGVDLSVAAASAGLFPLANRFEIATPLTWHDAGRRSRAMEHFRDVFDRAPAPRVVVIAGGADSSGRLSARAIEELEKSVGVIQKAGGTLFGLASAPYEGEIRRILGSDPRVLPLSRGDDVYLAHLAWADEFLVTGHSERILADVCKIGKPVQILPVEPHGYGYRFRAAVAQMADSAPLNNRGTVRPQQGLERLCSRLISRGIVRPPRNFGAVEDLLVQHGAATVIGSGVTSRQVLDESERVADQVRSLLGVR